MAMILPTLIITGLTALIVWGGFSLIRYLEHISGDGYGHDAETRPQTGEPPLSESLATDEDAETKF